MYPYFTIAWLKIYMTWLGIVVWFVFFLITVWYAAKQYRLPFTTFFYQLPIYIAIIYLFGAYWYFVIDNPRLLYPSTWNELTMLLSPHGYRFHLLWLIVGVMTSTWIFLKWSSSRAERILWLDVLFYGRWVALIPVWLFFVLWENFIWQIVELGHWRWVVSLHSDVTTRLRKFNQPVLPIGLRLSIGSGLIVIWYWLRASRKHRIGYGLMWFNSLLLLLLVVISYQQYPRHIPLYWLFDVKHYGIILCMIVLYIHYRSIQTYLWLKPIE